MIITTEKKNTAFCGNLTKFDVGNTAQGATWCCWVTEELQRSSGFDVREARVGVAAAGRCAEVSRATAFC